MVCGSVARQMLRLRGRNVPVLSIPSPMRMVHSDSVSGAMVIATLGTDASSPRLSQRVRRRVAVPHHLPPSPSPRAERQLSVVAVGHLDPVVKPLWLGPRVDIRIVVF